MRTIRCIGRLEGQCLPGGCLPGGRAEVCPGGCLPSRGVCLGPVRGGAGCLPAQGVSSCPGGVCLPWGCLQGQGCCTPPVDRMRDACENITFPQLLLLLCSLSSWAVELMSCVECYRRTLTHTWVRWQHPPSHCFGNLVSMQLLTKCWTASRKKTLGPAKLQSKQSLGNRPLK